MITNDFFNKKSLPEILSEDEFDYYFKEFKSGNSGALNILVSHNIRLVYWYIDGNINCEGIQYNEVFSVGLEALVEAFNSFDLNQKVKFSTFATVCIRNKILKYFRSESKHNKVTSLDELISDSHNANTLGDRIIDYSINIEDDYIEKENDLYLKEEIIKILNSFSELDKQIIMLYFGFYNNREYVQKEICEILNISQSQVSRRLASLLKKFRMQLNGLENEDNFKEQSFGRSVA